MLNFLAARPMRFEQDRWFRQDPRPYFTVWASGTTGSQSDHNFPKSNSFRHDDADDDDIDRLQYF